jgi:hypothetical protein
MTQHAWGLALLALTACGSTSAPPKGGSEQAQPTAALPPAAAASADATSADGEAEDTDADAGEEAKGLWPAGTCGFEPYLDTACDELGAPRFAVVLGEYGKSLIPSRKFKRLHRDEDASRPAPSRLHVGDLPSRPQDELVRAERALAAARTLGLAPGYPFAVSYDELPALDEDKRGIAIVAGLYATKAEAKALVASKRLKADVVELAPADAAHMVCDDWSACQSTYISVVEVMAPAKAYDAKQIEKLNAAQDELPWVKYEKAVARYMKALERLPAACEVQPGRLFLANQDRLYRQFRKLAPVTCPDGQEAWVPWRATRLESAVVRKNNDTVMHQVVLVECDSPTLEERPFLPVIPEKLVADMGSCGD